MSDDLDGHQERNRSGYSWRRCLVCGGRLRISDPCADRTVLDRDGNRRIERGHRACLKEGVERWNRLNRPHSGPLEASRRDGWSWHDEPPRLVG